MISFYKGMSMGYRVYETVFETKEEAIKISKAFKKVGLQAPINRTMGGRYVLRNCNAYTREQAIEISKILRG